MSCCCEKDMLTIFKGYPTEFAGIPWIFVDFDGVGKVDMYQMDVKLGTATRHYDDLTVPVAVNFTREETNLPLGVNRLSVIIYDKESRGKPFTTSVPVYVSAWTSGNQKRAFYKMKVKSTLNEKERYILRIETATINQKWVMDMIEAHNKSDVAHEYIQGLINDESAEREKQDSDLGDQIDSEKTDRQTADNELSQRIDNNQSNLNIHINNKENPHGVNKTQVGLGNVQNVDTTNANNITGGTLSNDRLGTIPYSKLSGVQATIPDLAEIRSGAEKGATAVQPEDIPVKDVQVNGTSVVVDNVANIPIASVNNLGVVKVNPTRGLGSVSSGDLVIISATEAEITDKTNNSKPISPKRLDIAIREGLGNNSLTWTDTYKSSARNTIGAGQQRTTVVDSTTPTITLDKALANTDYQYGTITSLTISAVENSYLETNFYFTAGSEITVDLPDTLKIIGTPSFEANKQYAMSICNNTLIVGKIS